MCATFLVNYSNKEIAELYEILFPDSFLIQKRVLPYTPAPVVYFDPENKKQLTEMSFSLVPSWSKEAKVKFATHNARIETIAEKPTWKNSFKSKRCLVPLNQFIEPIYTGEFAGNMVRFGQENKVLTAAGLYDEWVNRNTGEVLQSFSIVTQEPTEFIAKIGHDRSPIFLNSDAFEYWLNPKNQNYQELLKLLKNQKQPDEFKVEIDRPLKKGWEKRA